MMATVSIMMTDVMAIRTAMMGVTRMDVVCACHTESGLVYCD